MKTLEDQYMNKGENDSVSDSNDSTHMFCFLIDVHLYRKSKVFQLFAIYCWPIVHEEYGFEKVKQKISVR